MNDAAPHPLPQTPTEWREAALHASTPMAALEAWREYLWLRPDDVQALLAQALCWRQLGQKGEEVETLQRALRIDRENAEVPLELSRAWLDLAEWDRAEGMLDKAEALGGDVAALRDRLLRERGTLPTSYARHLFNDYAPKFDAALKGLGYRAPDMLAEALQPHLHNREGLDILDLGCGTGLSGLPFRQRKRRLVGVDLAERMLAEAAKLDLYDLLVCADLVSALQSQAQWDLIIAADVFVYVGDLAATLAAVPAALRPDGLLAFTVEVGDGDHFTLQESRRYAHSPNYINGLLAKCQLRTIETRSVVLRQDRGQPIAGHVWIVALDSCNSLSRSV